MVSIWGINTFRASRSDALTAAEGKNQSVCTVLCFCEAVQELSQLQVRQSTLRQATQSFRQASCASRWLLCAGRMKITLHASCELSLEDGNRSGEELETRGTGIAIEDL